MQMCLNIDEFMISWINYVFLKFWLNIMLHLDTVMFECELKKWLWSLLFWSYWFYYYNCFMLFQQMTDHKSQDEDLKLIIHTIVTEEWKAECKYTCSDSDIFDWNVMNWMTQLFVWFFNNNEIDKNDIFFRQNMLWKFKKNFFWCIIMKIKSEHALTHAICSSSNWKLMTLTKTEHAHFNDLKFISEINLKYSFYDIIYLFIYISNTEVTK